MKQKFYVWFFLETFSLNFNVNTVMKVYCLRLICVHIYDLNNVNTRVGLYLGDINFTIFSINLNSISFLSYFNIGTKLVKQTFEPLGMEK